MRALIFLLARLLRGNALGASRLAPAARYALGGIIVLVLLLMLVRLLG